MTEEEREAKPQLRDYLASPIGRKLLTGITGLGLTVFIILHLLGNLTLLGGDPVAYNKYSDFLIGTGPLLIVLEIILLIFLLVHAYIGISIRWGSKRARRVGYKKYRSAGGASLQSFSSRTMLLTGLVLLVFLVIHLASFKFGPSVDEGYVMLVDGRPIRDLTRLVLERFQSPLYAFGYAAVMVLLGFHLRHGIWSALQSLGAMNPKLTPVIYALGGLFAVLIALGFLVLPVWIFFAF